jgi:hypothetical protein
MPESEQLFWAADRLVKSQVIKIFASTGAKVIVVETGPSYGPTIGWQRIEKTGRYAYMLPVSGDEESGTVQALE